MALVAVAVGAGLIVGAGIYAASRRPSLPGIDLDEMQQTAKEGEPRVQVWGTVRPTKGNIVAAEDPPRIVRRRQSGGKGGSGPRSEHPYRTYAIGVCEGPITGYRRIWRNNKLVYDARPGSDWGNTQVISGIESNGSFGFTPIFATNNQTFLDNVSLYLGAYSQEPDASLEQIFGVGQVPAMRGTAYMVVRDEDLSDMNGAVPQWTFEVGREGGHAFERPPDFPADHMILDVNDGRWDHSVFTTIASTGWEVGVDAYWPSDGISVHRPQGPSSGSGFVAIRMTINNGTNSSNWNHSWNLERVYVYGRRYPDIFPVSCDPNFPPAIQLRVMYTDNTSEFWSVGSDVHEAGRSVPVNQSKTLLALELRAEFNGSNQFNPCPPFEIQRIAATLVAYKGDPPPYA